MNGIFERLELGGGGTCSARVKEEGRAEGLAVGSWGSSRRLACVVSLHVAVGPKTL